MQGKKGYQEKLFITFRLSDHVPQDNIYRRLNETVDFSFLYRSTYTYYGKEGQKSIDPVVFMKLMLAGYLENLNSDRRIISMARMRMDILYFIGYDLDEELPWHSTLSRTRQLYGQEVFTELFKKVLKQCIDKGMVSGRRQAVDGVYLKANASMDSLVEREIMADAEDFSKELSEQGEASDDVVRFESKSEPQEVIPNKKTGNKTHYSPSDPDARMSVKPGKAVALNYLGQVGVDMASHTITHVQVFTADKRDCQCLPEMLPTMVNTLAAGGLKMQEIVADTGYSSPDALKSIEENRLTGYIPNPKQVVYSREGFIYDPQENQYICPVGEALVYKGRSEVDTDIYRLSKRVCNECSLKDQCSVMGANGASIRQTVDKAYYDRMHERMQTRKAKILMKKRQSTVEPVIGTLVDYLGIKKLRCKGLAQANKCLTLAAVAYNLKKLLKHRTDAELRKLQIHKPDISFNDFTNSVALFYRGWFNLLPITQ
ncbi:IS1182 family transposase [Daejeonella sp.]|uniref:IS1182 family transposase n=1 Tax=Daejeonella sp. TaxID=2805397 RepID=UPI00272FB325|nr:IS1182 family transposase [Daejeonella sp.]MDP2413708.1 IS1182 family transposase [Daejeonella sp.]